MWVSCVLKALCNGGNKQGKYASPHMLRSNLWSSSLHFLTAEALIYAFITSHLDDCRGIPSGVSSQGLDRLQYFHNLAARILPSTSSQPTSREVPRRLQNFSSQAQINPCCCSSVCLQHPSPLHPVPGPLVLRHWPALRSPHLSVTLCNALPADRPHLWTKHSSNTICSQPHVALPPQQTLIFVFYHLLQMFFVLSYCYYYYVVSWV